MLWIVTTLPFVCMAIDQRRWCIHGHVVQTTHDGRYAKWLVAITLLYLTCLHNAMTKRQCMTNIGDRLTERRGYARRLRGTTMSMPR